MPSFLNTQTKEINKILNTHAIPINKTGLLESPRPRNIALMALYPNIKTIPLEAMVTYFLASINASSGVRKILSSGFVITHIKIIINKDIIKPKVNIVPITSWVSSFLLAP